MRRHPFLPDWHPKADLSWRCGNTVGRARAIFTSPEVTKPDLDSQHPLSQPEDLTGLTVGRFVIQERLGRGAMGEVYRADDTRLKRTVALKRIAARLRADQSFRERLTHEAQLASQLNDPHIAAVYDIFDDGGETFLVMEHVEGETLKERLRKRLSLAEFFDIATQCVAALVTAHEHGILHRDIKPANIALTSEGQVKMLDFGLAKHMPGSGESTTFGIEGPSFGGTPAYAAPEVLLAKGQDARSDIFSLGVVFAEMLAGENPFRAENLLATCRRITEGRAPRARSANPLVPPQLDEIVAKMLAKEPRERYATSADLAADLLAAREALPGSRPLSQPVRPATRRRILTGALALAAITAVAVAVGLYRRYRATPVSRNGWILMTDFANRSGQPLFEDTVGDTFRRALEQSHSVRLVPREQEIEAARLLGRSQLTYIDAKLGREICQRGNCQAVLTGEITSAGSTYRIGVTLEDPWSEATLFTDQADFQSPNRLYPALDKLAQNLRKHLGESLAEVQKSSVPLAEVTTPSLEALQRYTSAKRLFDSGDLQDALPLAKSALDLDPAFPMGHLLVAQISDRIGDATQLRQHLAAATTGLDRVTERERYLIQAMNFADRALYEKAAEQYRLLAQLYPDDLLAYQGLSASYGDMGQLEQAADAERRVIALNPDSALDYNVLMNNLNWTNRFSQALEVDSAARKRGIGSPLLHWGAGLALLGQGDTQAAAREFDLLKQAGDYGANLASFFQADLLAYQGRLAEATDSLQSGLVLGQKLGSVASVLPRRDLLARIALVRGRRAEALAETRALARQASQETDPERLRDAALIAVELGDLPLARHALADLDRLRSKEPGSGLIQSCYYAVKGAIDLAQADAQGAIASERAALVYFAPSPQAARILAQAYARERDWSGAVNSCNRYLDFHGKLLGDGAAADWVMGHLELARMLASAGRKDEAERAYDRFLSLWLSADAGLAIVEQARAERQRLRTMPGAADKTSSGPK